MMAAETEKEDLRIRRTRKLLREALVQLLTEKGFAAITVTDLAERAMINRATFYRHYQDKQDLWVHCAEAWLEGLTAAGALAGGGDGAADEAGGEALAQIFAYTADNHVLARLILGRDVPAAYAARVRDYLAQLARRLARAPAPAAGTGAVPVDVAVHFTAAGYLGALTWWLEQGMPYTAAQMARFLTQAQVIMPFVAPQDEGGRG